MVSPWVYGAVYPPALNLTVPAADRATLRMAFAVVGIPVGSAKATLWPAGTVN
jgi:hypothetical protein